MPSTYLRDVHLSDGAHFENLALYELIRRHCRYVLVSDCGADPTVAFDDLGNALRRIREDFGVEISLDVSPLRPGPDGRSRQHVAVGTIHYSPTDRGILLYVKPSITGDEPPDVLQVQDPQHGLPARRDRRPVLRRSAVGVIPAAGSACRRVCLPVHCARGRHPPRGHGRLGVR